LADKYPIDEDFPPEDPGNQLRAKLNGTDVAVPKSFAEVLYTASERGLTGGWEIKDPADAMLIVNLFFVARAIDMAPGDEVARIRM